MVWLACEGETSADKEYMGPIHYTPMQGFPGYYFPFVNQNHYLRYYIEKIVLYHKGCI